MTLHSLNKLDYNLKAMAYTNTVSFTFNISQESSFVNQNLPMRFGARKIIKKLGQFKDDGSLISVKMYDYATYMSLFDTKLETMGRVPLKIDDSETRKILVFS